MFLFKAINVGVSERQQSGRGVFKLEDWSFSEAKGSVEKQIYLHVYTDKTLYFYLILVVIHSLILFYLLKNTNVKKFRFDI